MLWVAQASVAALEPLDGLSLSQLNERFDRTMVSVNLTLQQVQTLIHHPPPQRLAGLVVSNGNRSFVMDMPLEETLTGSGGVWQLAGTVDKRVVAEGMLTPLSKALVEQWDALGSLEGDPSLLPLQNSLAAEEAELDMVNDQCSDLQRQLTEAGMLLNEDASQGPPQTSEYSMLRSELERIPMPQVCRSHPFAVQCVAL